MSVFLRDGEDAAHVALWCRPLLGCFRQEVFNSRGGSIDQHADRLIGVILESVDRPAWGVNAIARGQIGPGTIEKETYLTLYDIEPFVFVVVVMRRWPAAWRTDAEKSRKLLPGLFAVEQYDKCLAKCVQRTASVGGAPGENWRRRHGSAIVDT